MDYRVSRVYCPLVAGFSWPEAERVWFSSQCFRALGRKGVEERKGEEGRGDTVAEFSWPGGKECLAFYTEGGKGWKSERRGEAAGLRIAQG